MTRTTTNNTNTNTTEVYRQVNNMVVAPLSPLYYKSHKTKDIIALRLLWWWFWCQNECHLSYFDFIRTKMLSLLLQLIQEKNQDGSAR